MLTNPKPFENEPVDTIPLPPSLARGRHGAAHAMRLCDARAKAECVLLFVTVVAPGGIASKREFAFERESTCSRSSESPHARVERESTRICLVLPRLSSGAFVERESPHASASERESTLPIPLTRLMLSLRTAPNDNY